MNCITNSKNEIEAKGWTGIDVIMELLNENVERFSAMTDIDPNEIRRYINAELETIIKNAWRVKNVSMLKMRNDVRLS